MLLTRANYLILNHGSLCPISLTVLFWGVIVGLSQVYCRYADTRARELLVFFQLVP